MFDVNVGTADRVVRIVFGALLLAMFFMIEAGPWGWVMALVGAVLLATGLASRCAFYSLIGVDTRGSKAT